MNSLASIKKGESIVSNGKDVLIIEKYLWLFRANGELVKKVPIRRPYSAVFLPNSTAFVKCVRDTYFLISLETGDVLWMVKAKMPQRVNDTGFVVSPDGSTIYNIFYLYKYGKSICYLERICPDSRLYEIYPIEEGMDITNSIFCEPDGTLCALQHQRKSYFKYEDEEYACHSIHQHGILAIPFQDGHPSPYWKRQWEITDGGRYSFGAACDGKYIIFEDLSVLNMETQQTFFLLSDEERKTVPWLRTFYTYDSERALLTLQFLGETFAFERQKVIVDCRSRKIVARYVTKASTDKSHFKAFSVGFLGCLVGDSFWIGTEDEGVVRLPFPNSTPPIPAPTEKDRNQAYWDYVRATSEFRKKE